MSDHQIKILTPENNSFEISPAVNGSLTLLKAVSFNEVDFLLNPSLHFVVRIGLTDSYSEFQRSFASFIDPYHVNTRVIEFDNFVLNSNKGIKFKIESYNKEKKVDYKIGVEFTEQ